MASAWTNGPVRLAAACAVWASSAPALAGGVTWPGAGAGQPNPGAGYPPVSFWKEEGVVGNGFINAQIDQNGTIYDLYFPGAGAVYGVGTRNEGYAGGVDTFPPFTSGRGQMHVNQCMAGVRVDGLTHWFSNPNAASFSGVSQSYHPTSQSITTSRRLLTGGADLTIVQHDFSPELEAGPIGYPAYPGGQSRSLHVQRFLITNNSPQSESIEFYFYADWALNGGDGSDAAYYDTATVDGQPVNAMIAFDNAGGTANGRAEYNPTTFPDYAKNVSVYLGFTMKWLVTPGAASGAATDGSWRTLGSADNGQGWIGNQFPLGPGETREVDVLIAGGFDPFAGATGTGDVQIRPAVSWFRQNSMAAVQAQTDAYWTDWLASGTTIDTPDDAYDRLFRRGLLATALHVDGPTGSVIAGFHNGAYPYVWPRDAVYAAMTFARTGHFEESRRVYQWMRDTAFRDGEPWGKGFWKQKYTTDGYTVWGAPQIDETAVLPWGVRQHFEATGDAAFLGSMYPTVREAAFTMSSTPSRPADLSRLNFNPAVGLMYSNNVWEDQYDFFIYSNANVVRGLDDARAIAAGLGIAADAADFLARRDTIKAGLDARLDANAEATDISQLGVVYPFRVYTPTDPRAARYVDRINGVAPDSSGANRGLINYDTAENRAKGWVDLVNRYVGDGYWGGGPWFLSTLWYGLYYAERADHTPGKGDIDNHKRRVDLAIAKLGPLGLGAEQIAAIDPPSGPASPLLYPNQVDFTLQTAWPNAWESMSTFVDALLAFVDARPDAPAGSIGVAPKLPTGWTTLSVNNLRVGDRRVNLTVAETATAHTHVFTNAGSGAVSVATTFKLPPGASPCGVTYNGAPLTHAFDAATGRVVLAAQSLASTTGATGSFRVGLKAGSSPDWNRSGAVGVDDIFAFLSSWFAGAGDFNGVGGTAVDDIFAFLSAWFAPCP